MMEDKPELLLAFLGGLTGIRIAANLPSLSLAWLNLKIALKASWSFAYFKYYLRCSLKTRKSNVGIILQNEVMA